MGELKGKGAFGVPPGEVTVDNPDGVMRTYPGGETRHSLYDATYVSSYGGTAYGYGAFPGESMDVDGPMPWGGNDGHYNGAATDTGSKKPIGRQR